MNDLFTEENINRAYMVPYMHDLFTRENKSCIYGTQYIYKINISLE